jgi:hypothetical protein
VTVRKLALAMCTAAMLCGCVPGSVNAAPALQTAGAAPKNLRVTGVTDWTVALAWDAAKGKAPSSYVVQ